MNADQPKCKDLVADNWKSRKNAFQSWYDQAMEGGEMDNEEYGSFYDYGLSVDYVEPGTFDGQNEGYGRYQLSWGGPSDELRFFFSPRGNVPYRIEYWYMDWFDGASIEITDDPIAQWLWEQFHEMGTFENTDQ